jgi:hypothetical protein
VPVLQLAPAPLHHRMVRQVLKLAWQLAQAR